MDTAACASYPQDNITADSNLLKAMQRRTDLKQEIAEMTRAVHELTKTLKAVDQDILRTCNHKWEKDWEQELGPYDRRDTVCSICHTRNVACGY